jgi:prepilin peptidase CpaA
MSPLTLALLLTLGLLLVRAMVTDWQSRTIANGLNATIAGLAPFWWWATGLHPAAIGWQLGLSLLLLLLFAGLFAIRAMGGGDVKLIAAVALWLPPMLLLPMLWWMAVTGGALTATMLIARRLRPSAEAVEVPYGLAIGSATIGILANHILTNLAA